MKLRILSNVNIGLKCQMYSTKMSGEILDICMKKYEEMRRGYECFPPLSPLQHAWFNTKWWNGFWYMYIFVSYSKFANSLNRLVGRGVKWGYWQGFKFNENPGIFNSYEIFDGKYWKEFTSPVKTFKLSYLQILITVVSRI